jgi:hypothetical protein
MTRTVTVLTSLITGLLLLVGCAPDAGSGSTDTSATDRVPGSRTPERDHPTPKSPAADLRAFPDDTEPQSGKGSSAAGLVLVDVRTVAAESFDRVVLEFSGTGTPGWFVGYVDDAVLDGSGEVVDLDGRAVLDIYASGTTWPASDYYDGPTRITARSRTSGLTDLYVGGTFEGTTQVLAGVDGAATPFRVFTREAPPRLVVDVADGDFAARSSR